MLNVAAASAATTETEMDGDRRRRCCVLQPAPLLRWITLGARNPRASRGRDRRAVAALCLLLIARAGDMHPNPDPPTSEYHAAAAAATASAVSAPGPSWPMIATYNVSSLHQDTLARIARFHSVDIWLLQERRVISESWFCWRLVTPKI
jgi:hypothetical protein